MRGIVVAGTHSGCGKTTVSMGLMATLSRRYSVQPYKVGPDFIDPSHHTAICGRPSVNLDAFMMGVDGVRGAYARYSADADISVVEGVMGMFDGMGTTETASTAHIAKVLDLPVLLVVDVRSMSRSAAALVKGYVEYDPHVDVVGVILNGVASESHERLVREPIEALGVRVLGAVPSTKGLSMPSRHLGLHMAHEGGIDVGQLRSLIEEHVDIDAVCELARIPDVRTPDVSPPDDDGEHHSIRLGVAYDAAFCFYYHDLLEHLRRSGASITFFSPLGGDVPEVDGLYIGGGYPELYAHTLEHSPTTSWIRTAAGDEMPIYGECGGLMYLCEHLADGGHTRAMCGVLPATTIMTKRLVALAYVEAEVIRHNAIMERGIRGHEFHYSITQCREDARLAYRLKGGVGIRDGMDALTEHSTLASYTHVATFDPTHFIESCRRYARK